MGTLSGLLKQMSEYAKGCQHSRMLSLTETKWCFMQYIPDAHIFCLMCSCPAFTEVLVSLQSCDWLFPVAPDCFCPAEESSRQALSGRKPVHMA